MLTTKRLELPSADKRWRIVDATIRRNGSEPHALIEVLHTVQECFGFIDATAMSFVARALHLPLSKVFGVVTFYHYFTLKPPGQHTCVVCLGTACYIKGAPQLLTELQASHGIRPGETTSDGGLSLLQARCLGSCGLAPAVTFDGQMVGRVTVPELQHRIASLTTR